MSSQSEQSEQGRTGHNQRHGTPASGATRRRMHMTLAASLLVVGGVVAADSRGGGDGLRRFIGEQVGGIEKLKVPATNAAIPVPPGPASQPDRYETTEAKRFLGKMLFHDPVRTARININQAVPVDLPVGTAFGGTLPASDPNVAAIDPLSRRDLGLEFLDVTAKAHVVLIDRDRNGGRQRDAYRITNNGASVIDTHLLIEAKGLPDQVQLVNRSGTTQAGDPYLRVFLADGVIAPGQSIVVSLRFERDRQDERKDPELNYSLGLLSGQGKP